ncbi:hypothetical protein ACMD2_21215 [Ananas comosus]|uniref:Uncharacterized protein n=1 Tax=Ananas comosus TaxID=4615 RepID=A0A199VN33_ANACO|nr:hypothetical protein ACMD2_21215 [Ananas comosus]
MALLSIWFTDQPSSAAASSYSHAFVLPGRRRGACWRSRRTQNKKERKKERKKRIRLRCGGCQKAGHSAVLLSTNNRDNNLQLKMQSAKM